MSAAGGRFGEVGASALPPAAMLTEYALLGLVELAGGQSHGYALTHQFDRGKPLASILQLDAALLYYYLKKLTRRGWVTMARSDQSTRPARQLCQITALGRDALWDWIAVPCDAIDPKWTAFLLKLFLVQRLDSSRTAGVVGQQLAACRSSYEELLLRLDIADPAECFPNERDDPFSRLVLRMQMQQLQAFMGWLGEASTWQAGQAGRRAS